MFSLRPIVLALLAITFLVCVIDARIADQYEDSMALPVTAGDYRLRGWSDYITAHKRVPSAGDMMVRFGKRSV
ncbi:unnamed protein product [Cylicocyclus nassatus]|uniref:Uncharacterized protein n=1 Tax=Cylicocyclus nassatus TaxID=53992 RepID=A0AA36GRH0_CYLNA|nr:unnamed protein product [Cylicocyclus nassatus]